MNLILCSDDNYGMAFNNRRQSKDCIVRQKILQITASSKLYMNSYSYSQFEEAAENIVVDESFIQKAEDNDFCFIETFADIPTEKINKIYMFMWNTVYPSDIKFDFIPMENVFYISESSEFPGNSHKKITLNVFERRF